MYGHGGDDDDDDDDDDDTLSRGPRFIAPQDVQTGRALVMKRSSLQSREGRAVYEKEASTMRSIAHPNIVQVKLFMCISRSRWTGLTVPHVGTYNLQMI